MSDRMLRVTTNGEPVLKGSYIVWVTGKTIVWEGWLANHGKDALTLHLVKPHHPNEWHVRLRAKYIVKVEDI